MAILHDEITDIAGIVLEDYVTNASEFLLAFSVQFGATNVGHAVLETVIFQSRVM